MLRGNRGVFLALGIVFSALLGLGGGFILLNSATQEEALVEQQTNAKTNAYANRAEVAKERRCRGLPAKSQFQCVREENQAARDGRHNEYDLKAQRMTAIWTRYMGIAAIAGTGFGIIGIALILATFHQNRRSADAAHDANRPWIEAKTDKVRLGISLEQGGRAEFEVLLTNHGNSPATNVFAFGALVAIHGYGIRPKNPILPLIEAKLAMMEKRKKAFGSTIFPSKDDRQPAQADFSSDDFKAVLGDTLDHLRWLLAIGVTYRFGDRVFRTVETFQIAIAPGDVDYAAERTEQRHVFGGNMLVDTLEGYAT